MENYHIVKFLVSLCLILVIWYWYEVPFSFVLLSLVMVRYWLTTLKFNFLLCIRRNLLLFVFWCRTFVMPSRMCINPIHNKKGLLHQSTNASSEERYFFLFSSPIMFFLYAISFATVSIHVVSNHINIVPIKYLVF